MRDRFPQYKRTIRIAGPKLGIRNGNKLKADHLIFHNFQQLI
jgi:hypothetical protein